MIDSFYRFAAAHELHVFKDEGLYRHIRMQGADTSEGYFDLITWPGALFFTGDFGSYMFKRAEDMFAFFRSQRGADGKFSPPYDYWAQKCECSNAGGEGVQEFDAQRFRRELTTARRAFLLRHGRRMTAAERVSAWQSMGELNQFIAEGEQVAWFKLRSWRFELKEAGKRFSYLPGQKVGLDMRDFSSCRRYTRRYLLCCHAIGIAIEAYDKANQEEQQSFALAMAA